MNLDNNPTPEGLQALLRGCDDRAGNHVLWVKRTGEVEISRLPAGKSLAAFQQEHPEMQLRYEAFQAGNEYVGPEAADDPGWLAHLFESLLTEWRNAKGQAEAVYTDEVFRSEWTPSR